MCLGVGVMYVCMYEMGWDEMGLTRWVCIRKKERRGEVRIGWDRGKGRGKSKGKR